jgi:hypothetical protein
MPREPRRRLQGEAQNLLHPRGPQPPHQRGASQTAVAQNCCEGTQHIIHAGCLSSPSRKGHTKLCHTFRSYSACIACFGPVHWPSVAATLHSMNMCGSRAKDALFHSKKDRKDVCHQLQGLLASVSRGSLQQHGTGRCLRGCCALSLLAHSCTTSRNGYLT